jgi:hypothetical protein
MHPSAFKWNALSLPVAAAEAAAALVVGALVE